MTTTRSYSPHGIVEPNPDYLMCCKAYHATTAAKFFACYYFVLCLIFSGINFMLFGFDKFWLSVFCVIFTIHCIIVMYGVFLEKKSFLILFLAAQGLITVSLFVLFCVVSFLGAFTDFIREHHKETQPLRDLYDMHKLNPDDEKTQTLVSSSVLFIILSQLLISAYSWYVIFRCYKCFGENDRTICPGYQKGIVASEHEL